MPKPGALACGLVLIFAAANALPSTHTHHDAVHDALLELEKDVSAMDSLPAQHGANFERRREACERRVSDDDDLLKACHKCLRWGWWNRCSFHPATQRCESTSASTASIFAGGEYLVASKDGGTLTAAQVPLQKCSWLKVAVVFDWDHTIASAHMYSELQYQQPGSRRKEIRRVLRAVQRRGPHGVPQLTLPGHRGSRSRGRPSGAENRLIPVG